MVTVGRHGNHRCARLQPGSSDEARPKALFSKLIPGNSSDPSRWWSSVQSDVHAEDVPDVIIAVRFRERMGVIMGRIVQSPMRIGMKTRSKSDSRCTCSDRTRRVPNPDNARL
jgi:hypothetical protein